MLKAALLWSKILAALEIHRAQLKTHSWCLEQGQGSLERQPVVSLGYLGVAVALGTSTGNGGLWAEK